MGQFKELREFSVAEVGLWLTAQGLGNHVAAFRKEGVDGDFLVTLAKDPLQSDLLTKDKLQSDLGLSGLQADRLLRNIEFTQNLSSGEGAGEGEGEEELERLREKVAALSREVESLQKELGEGENAQNAVQSPRIKELQERIGFLEAAATAKDEEIAALEAKAKASSPRHCMAALAVTTYKFMTGCLNALDEGLAKRDMKLS